MAKAALDRIIEEIKTLDEEERRRLREVLDTMAPPAEEEHKREALRQALRAAGLVTQVRQPRASDTPNRRLIPVQGKPVSETIIEERR
jgi:hypothetical protein